MKKHLRRAGVVSLTLGAFGCGEPSQPEALRPDELFSSDTTRKDSLKGEGWRKFLSPAELHRAWAPDANSPWRPYHKTTLIAAIATVESAAAPVLNVGMPPALSEAKHYAESAPATETAIFLDLVGEQSVVWASELKKRGYTPVLAVNNWPHQYGILRLERPLGALLYYADEVAREKAPVLGLPVFILERSRLAQKDLTPTSNQFDNRYFHARTDFPTAEVFKSRGIKRLIYVNPRGITPGCEEDDLNDYFVDLAQSGMLLTYVRSHPSGFDAGSVTPVQRHTIFTKSALAEYSSSPDYHPHYHHSYYHYHTWHRSYWSRSPGAWGGDNASSGWSSSGSRSSGFSS